MFKLFDSSTHISLDQIQTILENLPMDCSDITINENLSLINRIGQPEYFIPILERILNEKDLRTNIARQSYRHVNHFDKIVLIDSENKLGYRLTLHLWSPPYTEKELSDELIHDHRFNFWSTILTGDLISENFIKDKIGRVFRQYQYLTKKRSLSNFYEFVGETTLTQMTTSKMTVGETYYLSYEHIHRVLLPRTSMTCTLVLRGPRQRVHSNVYNTTYPETKIQMANAVFSENQLAMKILVLSKVMAMRLNYR